MSFSYIDKHNKTICQICIGGILKDHPDYSFGLHIHGREFIWDERPTYEVIHKLKEYLANPQCTVDRHLWFEERICTKLVNEANNLLYKAYSRKDGWSIKSA